MILIFILCQTVIIYSCALGKRNCSLLGVSVYSLLGNILSNINLYLYIYILYTSVAKTFSLLLSTFYYSPRIILAHSITVTSIILHSSNNFTLEHDNHTQKVLINHTRTLRHTLFFLHPRRLFSVHTSSSDNVLDLRADNSILILSASVYIRDKSLLSAARAVKLRYQSIFDARHDLLPCFHRSHGKITEEREIAQPLHDLYY